MYATGEKHQQSPQIEGAVPQSPFLTREEREEFVKGLVPGLRKSLSNIYL